MTNANTSKHSRDSRQNGTSEQRSSSSSKPPRKAMKKLVAAIEFGEGEDKRNRWTRIGTGFENQDGSWNLLFDLLPTQRERTTIQLRDIDVQED